MSKSRLFYKVGLYHILTLLINLLSAIIIVMPQRGCDSILLPIASSDKNHTIRLYPVNIHDRW